MLSSSSTTSLPSQHAQGREVVEFDESIEHVEREEKL
jgi:hypothetical protein